MTLARHTLDITMAAGSASAQTWPHTSIRPVEPSASGKLVNLIVRHGAEPLARIIVADKAKTGGCSARSTLNPRQEKADAHPAGNRSAEFMVWLHTGIDKMKKLVDPHSITLPEQAS